MAAEPKDLLDWASETVCDDGIGEVCLRACASRAYYAAYHSVTWIGEQLPPAHDKRGGVHDQLCGQLQSPHRPDNWRSKDLTLRSLGYILQQQRDVRVRADYKLSEDFTSDDAEESIRRAGQILEMSAALSPPGAGEPESS